MGEALLVNDPEARRWFARQHHLASPKLHLLLGDSIARDAGLRSRLPREEIMNLASSGATWAKVNSDLKKNLARWREAAETRGRRRGTVILWLTGNDVYGKDSHLSSFDDDRLASIADTALEVIAKLRGEEVLVLGPLPRLSGEAMGIRWVRAAAYHLERRLLHSLPPSVRLVPLGRQLTRRSQNRHSVTNDCAIWFRWDRTHLNRAGYAKVSDALPVWLVCH